MTSASCAKRSPGSLTMSVCLAQISALVSCSVTLRDELLSRGILSPLLACGVAAALLRSAVSCLESLTRLAPWSQFAALSAMLPTLGQLVYAHDDGLLTHSLTALAALSDDDTSDHSQIQEVIQMEDRLRVCRRVVELTMHRSVTVKALALTVIGNLCRGNDMHRQVLINCSALPYLLALLAHADLSIRRLACAAIAHICSGNIAQLKQVIDEGIVPPLISMLKTDELEVQREAARAIVHASSHDLLVRLLASAGSIAPLCRLLSCPDPSTVMVAMEGIENILRVGKADAAADPLAINQYAHAVDRCKGRASLQALQQHASTEISSKAVSMLASYFAHEERAEEEGDDEAEYGSQFGDLNFSL